MRLGNWLGYRSSAPTDREETPSTVGVLGHESAWSAEACGSDAFMPLRRGGARFPGFRLGMAAAKISVRTLTATAMTAMTLDHPSGGRRVLGIGMPGTRVVEGWHSASHPRPRKRTRRFVAIPRKVLARDIPVEHQGHHCRIPHTGGTGLGRLRKGILTLLRSELPVLIAAEEPRNVQLAAESVDGWLAHLFPPDGDGGVTALRPVAEGLEDGEVLANA